MSGMTDELTNNALSEAHRHAQLAARAHEQMREANLAAREQWARLFDATMIARVAGARWAEILGDSPARQVTAMWRTLGEDQQVRDLVEPQAVPLSQALRSATTAAEITTILRSTPRRTHVQAGGLSVPAAATLLRVPKATIVSWLECGILQVHPSSSRSPRVRGIA